MTLAMTMKPSEFYRELDKLEGDCLAHEREAQQGIERANKLASWVRGVLKQVYETQKKADEAGVPPDAREQLERFERMLEEGPPDGEGYVQPKGPERTRAPRKPCEECGNVGRHKVNPPCSKSGKTRSSAVEPSGHHASASSVEIVVNSDDVAQRIEESSRLAIQERNAAARAEDGARVDLADLYARYKALVEKAPQLPSEAAEALGVDLATLKAALEHQA